MSDARLGQSTGFFIAEVRNVKDDPEQAGRAKIRIKGLQDNLSDDELRWARPMFPTTSASKGGVGGPMTGLEVGSQVVGFFLDKDQQIPMMLGTFLQSGKSGKDGKLDTSGRNHDGAAAARDKKVSGDDKAHFETGMQNKPTEETPGAKIATFFGMKTMQDERSIGTKEAVRATGFSSPPGKELYNLVKQIDPKNGANFIKFAPDILKKLPDMLKKVPFDLQVPGISQIMKSGNILGGLGGLAGLVGGIGNIPGLAGALGSIGGIAGQIGGVLGAAGNLAGDVSGIIGQVGNLAGGVTGALGGAINAGLDLVGGAVGGFLGPMSSLLSSVSGGAIAAGLGIANSLVSNGLGAIHGVLGNIGTMMSGFEGLSNLVGNATGALQAVGSLVTGNLNLPAAASGLADLALAGGLPDVFLGPGGQIMNSLGQASQLFESVSMLKKMSP